MYLVLEILFYRNVTLTYGNFSTVMIGNSYLDNVTSKVGTTAELYREKYAL